MAKKKKEKKEEWVPHGWVPIIHGWVMILMQVRGKKMLCLLEWNVVGVFQLYVFLLFYIIVECGR